MTADVSFIAIFAGTLCCTSAFACNLVFDQYGGILVWIFFMLWMFKALGVICDEYFVPSLEVIVEKLQLSNDVAGATFMAAGSSAPELFTSLVATFLIVNEGGVGTIVGSAIFNILVIVGATGVIACKDQSLKIWWYPLCRDCFFYCLSILELVIVLSNESVDWYEGVIMILTYILYCVYMKFNPQIVKMLGIVDPSEPLDSGPPVEVKVKESQVAPAQLDDEKPNGDGATALRSLGAGEAGTIEEAARQPPELLGKANGGTVPVEEATTINVTEGSENQVTQIATIEKASVTATDTCKVEVTELLTLPKEGTKDQRRPSWGFKETSCRQTGPCGEEPSEMNRPQPLCVGESEGSSSGNSCMSRVLRDPLVVFLELIMPAPEKMGGSLLFFWSIIFIGIFTYVMVDSTTRVGVILHIPTLAMALVFLAAGTSIPDALGSIAVAKQGEGDMAVSNALGSNVFDILIVLGVPWTIKAGFMGKDVLFIGKWDELIYDIIVLIVCLVLFVGCLIAHKWYLTRKVGLLLLGVYIAFLVYNILAVWIIDPPLKKQDPQAHCDVI
jgi:K+-dependent Na+/Ca+ exchanger-like protein